MRTTRDFAHIVRNMELEEPVQLDVRYNPAAAPGEVSAVQLEHADVGDWLLVGEQQDLPEGWALAGGPSRRSADFLTFVRSAGITTPTFQLPERPARPGWRWAVRLR